MKKEESRWLFIDVCIGCFVLLCMAIPMIVYAIRHDWGMTAFFTFCTAFWIWQAMSRYLAWKRYK